VPSEERLPQLLGASSDHNSWRSSFARRDREEDQGSYFCWEVDQLEAKLNEVRKRARERFKDLYAAQAGLLHRVTFALRCPS
jgi:hypothetical protein